MITRVDLWDGKSEGHDKGKGGIRRHVESKPPEKYVYYI